MVVGAHPVEAIAYQASSSSRPSSAPRPRVRRGPRPHRRELSFGLGAVGAHRHRPETPPVHVGIDPDEHAQLERTGAALADRALHDRIIVRFRPSTRRRPWANHGHGHRTTTRQTSLKRTADQDFYRERTTGFEPATLTLAKNVKGTVRRVCLAP